MGVQQNTDHIQTTHIGSLPRPHDLLDLMKAKFAGQKVDEAALEAKIRSSVIDCVGRQVECGIEIVTDGEFSKPAFFTYIRERLEGFESRPDQKLPLFEKEVAACRLSPAELSQAPSKRRFVRSGNNILRGRVGIE